MSTEQTTNGHDVTSNGSTVRWMAATDVPAYLGRAVVPTPAVDETEIWGDEMPDPDALAAAVDRARRTVALQDVDELVQAKSPADLAEDIASRRRIRSTERVAEEEDAAAEVAERRAEIAHRHAMARIARDHAEAVAKARTTAEQLANPWHAVVRVHRGLRWVPLLGVVPALFALVIGAANVGTQLHRIFPDTPLVSWAVDPMITLLLVAIGGAHLYGAARDENGRNVFAWIEAIGFVLTSVAAVGLHYVDGPGENGAGATGTGPLIWLAVPVCLGLSMVAAPRLRERMEKRLEQAHEKARKTSSEEVLPTPSDLHGKNPGETSSEEGRKTSSRSSRAARRNEVTAPIPAPQKRTREDHRKRLAALVAAGEIDPETVHVNTVAKTVRCQWGTARDLLVSEYGRTDLVERGRGER